MLKAFTILCILALVLSLQSSSSFAKDKNPYQGTGDHPAHSTGRRGAWFTIEKKRPDKAERNAVFEDYRIPKDQRKNYVAEYRVPVSLGGSNAYSNIEALPKSQAVIKHGVQKQLLLKVQRKEITLDEAQLRILNWQTDALTKPDGRQ